MAPYPDRFISKIIDYQNARQAPKSNKKHAAWPMGFEPAGTVDEPGSKVAQRPSGSVQESQTVRT